MMYQCRSSALNSDHSWSGGTIEHPMKGTISSVQGAGVVPCLRARIERTQRCPAAAETTPILIVSVTWKMCNPDLVVTR